MESHVKRSLNVTIIAVSIYAFALSFLWNTLHPLILPYLIARFEPALKNTFLGLISAAGLVFAIVIQPLSGRISDRSRSRWGRRRPYIVAGTIGDVICLTLLAAATGYWFLFAAYCLLQVSSNVAHGPYQGFIPDLIPSAKQGVASGAKSLVELIALVIGSAIIGMLLGQDQPGLAFFAIAAVLLIAMALTVILVREEPAAGVAPQQAAPVFSVAAMLDGLHRHSAFAWYVFSRFLILVGLAAVRTFAQNYIQDVLKSDNPAAMAGQLMTILGLAVLIVVLPAGYLADRIGRRRLNVLSAAIGFVGTVLIITSSTFGQLVVYGIVVGVGVGIFMSANWALAMDLIPAAEAALFLGLTNLATAGSGAAAGLLGPVIDGLNSVAPGFGYQAVFALAALSWLLGGLILAKLPMTGSSAPAAR
jgi:MFS family permease